MTTYKLPLTGKIVFYPDHIGDIVVDYSNYPDIDSTIQQEDIKIIGDWTDFTGSKVQTAVNYEGIQDINPMTLKGELESQDINLTDRGRLASPRRQRPRLVHIELNATEN